MGVLEQLREDVREAMAIAAEGFVPSAARAIRAGRVGTYWPARCCDAGLDILDKFIAEHEEVEVRRFKGKPGEKFSDEDWLAMPGSAQELETFEPDEENYEVEYLTIIVPRAKEQTLAEAAEAYREWTKTHGTICSDDCDVFNGLHDALKAALKRGGKP
jgi:hypothetical protein